MNRLLLLFILLIFSFEGNAQRDDMLYGGKSLSNSTDTLANWRIYCNLKQQGIDTEITNIADHFMYLKLTNEGESISGSEIEIHFFNGKQWSYYETGNIFIINRSSTPFEPFETKRFYTGIMIPDSVCLSGVVFVKYKLIYSETRYSQRYRKDKDIVFSISPLQGENKEDIEPIYWKVDEPPQFPGGEQAFSSFMKNNVERPKDTPVYGIVKVVVEKDGTVRFPHSTRVHIIPFDERVFPAILRMPKWTPAYLGGKPVRSFYEMVVDIK